MPDEKPTLTVKEEEGTKTVTCVAVRACQSIKNGRAVFYNKGDVDEFPVCPTHFRPVAGEEGGDIDFDTAKEAELHIADYDLADLKTYIEETFGAKAGNRGKEKTIEMLLDLRFRSTI